MANIIDELVVLLRLDAKPFDKAAKEQVAAVQQATKKINISAEDQERIANSQAFRADKREKDRVRKQKQADRDKASSAEELGSKIKGIGLAVGAAVIGFDSLKGAINFLGNLSTSTAALGRTSDNLGLSAQGVQAWGNAIQLAGGDAKEAQSSFAALSQQMTAFKISGEIGPLLRAAQLGGVSPYDAEGKQKGLDVLLPQIVDALRARGFSRPDAFNLLSSAGVSEGLFNLLSDPNRTDFIQRGKETAFADAKKVALAQKANATIESWKQRRTQDIANAAAFTIEHPGEAYLRAVAFPITGTVDLLSTTAKDLYQAAFGEKGATVGVRANNPGNLMDKNGKLRQFSSMLMGSAALSSDLDYKIDRDGLNTIRKILTKYAPHLDANGKVINDTDAYIADVSKRVGLAPDAAITSREQRFNLVEAIVRHEQGKAGAAQVTRAVSTPGATTGGAPALASTGPQTNLTIGSVTVNTQATDAPGIATDFMGAMNRKLTAQSNIGITQ
jgi:hypothetical protein